MIINEKQRFSLKNEVAIEDFGEISLIFLCKQQRILTINSSAKRIIYMMDGKIQLKQIINKFSSDCCINRNDAQREVFMLIEMLFREGVLKISGKLTRGERIMIVKSACFLANPDASIRNERDGAWIYNDITKALIIINSIGVNIWKYIEGTPRSKYDIIKHLNEDYDGVPLNQIENDVDDFLNKLTSKGFIRDVTGE